MCVNSPVCLFGVAAGLGGVRRGGTDCTHYITIRDTIHRCLHSGPVPPSVPAREGHKVDANIH